ncbi:MAG TPA: hypothetical protein VGR43_06685 [Dehalococcoidia bacterium]|nr:hypothetical protein [Dehalococcoidia bacterium]
MPAAIMIPAAIFGCYRVLTEQDDLTQIVLGIASPIVTILTVAHYLWFYYVSVGDASLVQVKYFGLVRRRIMLSELSRVRVSVFRGWLFNSPHLRFEWPDGEIDLIVDVYDKRAIKNALARLDNAGVPVDSALLAAKWLPP